MIRLTTLAFALAFAMPAAAAPTDAAATSPALAQAPAQPQQAKPKKICRNDIETGSIMPKRICKDAKEWGTIDAQNQRSVDDTMNRPTSASALQH